MSILSYVNPFRLYRNLFWKPMETFLFNQYSGYKKKTDKSLTNAKELIYKAAVLIIFLSAIVWLSIFLYVVFYHTYMPNVTHVRSTHFQFKPCDDTMGICSFPYAYVQLTKTSQILMPAQAYRIKLVLDMPESQINKDLGMFMVCTQMRAKGGVLVSSSCRSAMLRYRSKLHQIIRTLVLCPFLVFDMQEERQELQVDLFSEFSDDPSQPVTDAYVELQSRYVQIYNGELRIEAHFIGLRYIMYNWPKLSAVFGISTNLFFVTFIFMLSWYHLQDGLPEYVKMKLGHIVKPEEEEEEKALVGKIKLEREELRPQLYESDVLLEEFMQIEEKKEQK